MIYLNDENFMSEIGNNFCIVDFFADWCGPCKMLEPVFAEVAKEYGSKCKFFKVNVDDAPITASKFSVMSIPTLIIFKNGEKKALHTGFLTKDGLEEFIDTNL